MATRLQVIEEIKIEYEVPYVTNKGEIIDSTTIQINEQRQGISISYAIINPTG